MCVQWIQFLKLDIYLLLAQEDDEWKEFEEEKKDYTGLKIGNLHIEGEGVGGEGDEEDDQEMEENEAGELVPKRKVQSGPWKMVKQPQPTATEVSESQGNLKFMGEKRRSVWKKTGINGQIILSGSFDRFQFEHVN